jgi:hypothetical protein
MTKPGPSSEYLDLLSGRMTAEEYVERLKDKARERLDRDDVRREHARDARSAAA